MNNLLKCSIDERDVNGYLTLEQYLIERNFCINYEEWQLLLKKQNLLQMKIDFLEGKKIIGSTKDILLHQTEIRPQENNDLEGLAVFLKNIPRERKQIKLFCNVKKISREQERKRNMLYNLDEIKDIETLNKYLDERNRLLNDKEYTLLQEKVRELKFIYEEIISKYDDCYVFFEGEFIERCNGRIINHFYYFDNLICDVFAAYNGILDIKTNIRYYEPLSLERRRNDGS